MHKDERHTCETNVTKHPFGKWVYWRENDKGEIISKETDQGAK